MNADRINELYAGKIFAPETQMRARERIHWICRQARGKRILDIGCSQGIVCLLLAREGFNCVGIDYEKTAIEYALEELKKEEDIVRKRVEFKIGDAVHLSFEDDSFDTVILGEIIEHLNHPEKVLKEAKRVLKDGGMAIITVPFGLNPDPDHKRTYYPVSFLERVQPFFKTDIIDTIDNYIIYCGIKDVSYSISKVSKEALLLESLRLQNKTEERFLLKEQELFAKSKQFNDKVKTLTGQVSSLSKMNKDLKEAIARKEKEIKDLQAGKAKELEDKEREYEAKLREKDQAHKEAIAVKESEIKDLQAGKVKELEDREREFEAKLQEKDQAYKEAIARKEKEIKELQAGKVRELESKEREFEAALKKAKNKFQVEKNLYRSYNFEKDQIFKRSITWRIGSAFVVPYILIRDFIKHPYKFCREPGKYFRRVYYHHYPRSKPALKENLSTAEGLQTDVKAKRGKHKELSTEKDDTTKETSKGNGIQIVKQKISVKHKDQEPIAPAVNVVSETHKAKKGTIKKLRDMTIACVMDEFTSACFDEEVKLVHVTPDNWKDVLNSSEIDMLFVESAWNGHNKSWFGILAYTNKAENNSIIREMTTHARKCQIPSVFWNKEDPPHYEVFKKAASYFDFIFTTDSNMIPKYCSDLSRSQVSVLPFAAQPAIHNPIGKIEESGKDLLFAGTWYSHHKDRLLDYERILEPAMKFQNFHIYDRMFNSPKRDMYRYPEKYDPFIRGGLPYDELLREYKRYKVFLNINSVNNSPTMFSRRVYEVMLCGTPVISGYALGIEQQLGSDIVRLAKTPKEGSDCIIELLEDDKLRADIGRKGIRRIMEGHTYEDRIKDLLNTIGVSHNKADDRIAVWSLVRNKKELNTALDNFYRQRFASEKLTFYLGTMDSLLTSTAMLPQGTQVIHLKQRDSIEAALIAIVQASYERYLAFLDVNACYGPFYLMDQYHALKYSGCKMVGKASFVSFDGGIRLHYEGLENQILNAVECDLSSAVFDRSVPVMLKSKGNKWLIQKAKLKWYSTYPHGLIKIENIRDLPPAKVGSLSEIENWLS